nr:hypothetical protein [Tanacetum cinerariifolium]
MGKTEMIKVLQQLGVGFGNLIEPMDNIPLSINKNCWTRWCRLSPILYSLIFYKHSVVLILLQAKSES